jgi:hypothetical protein
MIISFCHVFHIVWIHCGWCSLREGLETKRTLRVHWIESYWTESQPATVLSQTGLSTISLFLSEWVIAIWGLVAESLQAEPTSSLGGWRINAFASEEHCCSMCEALNERAARSDHRTALSYESIIAKVINAMVRLRTRGQYHQWWVVQQKMWNNHHFFVKSWVIPSFCATNPPSTGKHFSQLNYSLAKFCLQKHGKTPNFPQFTPFL